MNNADKNRRSFSVQGLFVLRRDSHTPAVRTGGVLGWLVAAALDANTPLSSAMDGTREERLYVCQNWRGDVVKLISAAGGGRQVEGARYSSYGVPWGIALRDIDGDGDVDTDDSDFMLAWSGVSYDVRGDFDLDGDVDMDDEIIFHADSTPGLGWGNLSNLASRKGYAGYEHDGNFDTLAHVRHRVYETERGRWTRRDPAGFVDGPNLYGYVGGNPITDLKATHLNGSVLRRSTSPHSLARGWPPPNPPLNPQILPGPVDLPLHAPHVLPPVGFPPPSWSFADEVSLCNYVQPYLSNGDLGGVICYEGRKIGCYWPQSSYSHSAFPGGSIVGTCVREHEHEHFDSVDCSNCVAGYVCRPRTILKPGVPSGPYMAAEECGAYRAETACYSRMIGNCGAFQECRDNVIDEWDFACQQETHFCGTPGINCPAPPR